MNEVCRKRPRIRMRLVLVLVLRKIFCHGDQFSANVVPLVQNGLRRTRRRLRGAFFCASCASAGTAANTPAASTAPHLCIRFIGSVLRLPASDTRAGHTL